MKFQAAEHPKHRLEDFINNSCQNAQSNVKYQRTHKEQFCQIT